MSIKRTFEIKLTPTEIADAFADMNSTLQASFFNRLAEVVKDWDNPFCMQLEYIIGEEHLSPRARIIMQEIGDYGYEKR